MNFLCECLKGLILAISVMEILPMDTKFKCFSNIGHTPSIKQLMAKTRNFSIQQSAFDCALLCKNPPCLSFAYNPDTKHCFISNVTVEESGIFCGNTVEKTRKNCAERGYSYTAFGASGTPMQCVCGGKKATNTIPALPWTVKSGVSDVACIEYCGNSTCIAKIGNLDGCTICLGNNTSCEAELQPTLTANVNMSICTQANFYNNSN